MKYFLCLAIFASAALAGHANASTTNKMDWSGFKREHIELGYPLLIVKGSKGLLACGYISTKTCDKTKEACAIVSGVKTHDDMLDKMVVDLSEKAKSLGIKIGMSGRDALKRLK